MVTFDIGETVICSIGIKNEQGNFKNPSDDTQHIKITITDKQGVKKVEDVVMINDDIGKYHYDCQTIGWKNGNYVVSYKAVNGTRITIEKDTFQLQ